MRTHRHLAQAAAVERIPTAAAEAENDLSHVYNWLVFNTYISYLAGTGTDSAFASSETSVVTDRARTALRNRFSAVVSA